MPPLTLLFEPLLTSGHFSLCFFAPAPGFMHPFYPQESSRNAGDIFNGAPPTPQPQQQMTFQHQQLGNLQQQVNMDMLENLLAMQDPSAQSNQHQQHSSASATPQALLEHQLRLNQLQQLQQLQNQIFQQQLELLGGQSSFSNPTPVLERPRDTPQYGLPTPVSSAELRAQPSSDFVSPMLLHSSGNGMGSIVQNAAMLANFIPQVPQQMIPSGSHSAPPNIVFQSPGYPLNDAGDLDLSELPRISSPMLDSYNHSLGSSAQPPVRPRNTTSGAKRPNASSSGDESSVTNRPARKRPSPTERSPTAATSGGRKSGTRTTRSATSTPLFPATTPASRSSPTQRNVHGMGDVSGDTPSPVDPPMPPPAHPTLDPPLPAISGPSSSPTPPLPAPSASGPQANPITRVTPATMFKLGRLAAENPQQSAQDGKSAPKQDGKPTTRSTSAKSKAADKTATGQHISPALKPIRPAGNAVMMPATPSTPFMQPQIRKSSHKAAEQKRRDSLKTTFDDLRFLLPPIPLPSEEGFPDEPILPGAMPPRGPPKGSAEGPNRGVSKLQLLRCGNEYIKLLKGRVDRRDEEIARLRQEVLRLREIAGDEATAPVDGQDMIDLEYDLDACEIVGGSFVRAVAGAMRASSVGEGDLDEDGDM